MKATVALCLAVIVGVAACELPTRDGTDTNPRSAQTDRNASGDGGRRTSAEGASDCAEDAVTGTVLCSAVDVCPGLAVNHNVLPNCGFRPRGWRFDLACWCEQKVCRMGAPTTCDDARAILRSVTEAEVCAQSSGECLDRGASGGPDQGLPIGCNQDCLRLCGYTVECRQNCGCLLPQ